MQNVIVSRFSIFSLILSRKLLCTLESRINGMAILKEFFNEENDGLPFSQN